MWRLWRLFPQLLQGLPRVVATAPLLRRSTVRESLRRLGERATRAAAPELAEAAGRVASDLDFGPESRGGPESVELSRKADADIGADEDPRDFAGTVQARVAVAGPLGGEPAPRTATFAPERRHEITVRVGPGDPGWLRSDRPFPVDQVSADDGTSTAPLTLVLVAGGAEPQRREVGLVLRPGGSTRPQTFEVMVRAADVAADGTWTAHLLVYHRGRLLDYARLTGPVAERDRPVRGRRLELVDEAPVLADVRGLRDRTTFDASLTRLRGGQLALHSVPGAVGDDLLLDGRMFDGAAQISAEISAIAQQAGESGSRELSRAWRRLAEHGHRLRVLVHEAGGAVLDSAERVQLVDSVPDDLLPLEFVFAGGAPTRTARRCADWAGALATGRCAECPPLRPLDAAAERICPLHFWGLGKVIERSVHGERPVTGVLLRTDPGPDRRRLPVADAALVAVTDRVGRDPATKLAFDDMLVRVRASVAVTGRPLRTWRYWWKHVERDTPPLVLVIAHNTGTVTIGRQSPTGTLSIGADSRLTPAEVGRRWLLRDSGDAPVVLLLACNSVDPELPTAGFAARFRQGGAAIVIGSVADLWAAEAPTIAEALISGLTDGRWPAGTSVGAALLRVRRDLVAGGRPAGLGLAAFGDADWLLN